jgi:hypothetical protein
MFGLEKAHFVIDEMVMNGRVMETNKTKVANQVKGTD